MADCEKMAVEIKSPLEGKLGPCCRSTGCCRGGWRTWRVSEEQAARGAPQGTGIGCGWRRPAWILRLIVEGSPVAAKA